MTLNARADEIDPRTYFAIRGFLDEIKQNATLNNVEPELILPTTWILNFDEGVKKIEMMPLNCNNVDASVSANFLFGLIFQISQK